MNKFRYTEIKIVLIFVKLLYNYSCRSNKNGYIYTILINTNNYDSRTKGCYFNYRFVNNHF